MTGDVYGTVLCYSGKHSIRRPRTTLRGPELLPEQRRLLFHRLTPEKVLPVSSLYTHGSPLWMLWCIICVYAVFLCFLRSFRFFNVFIFYFHLVLHILIDWLIDWSINWLILWFIDWWIDWLIYLSIDWLIDWLIDRSIHSFIHILFFLLDRSAVYDFLLTFHSNHWPISYRFPDNRRFQSKIAMFLTAVYLTPRWEGSPLIFGTGAWTQVY